MCGIFGVWKEDGQVLPTEVIEATNQIRHRGPDDEGFLFVNTKTAKAYPHHGPDSPLFVGTDSGSVLQDETINLALGFRRLSIIDLSPAGHQPMSYANEQLWMVFNGEVYNYLELREELIAKGYIFKSEADSEVVIAAYQEWGAN